MLSRLEASSVRAGLVAAFLVAGCSSNGDRDAAAGTAGSGQDTSGSAGTAVVPGGGSARVPSGAGGVSGSGGSSGFGTGAGGVSGSDGISGSGVGGVGGSGGDDCANNHASMEVRVSTASMVMNAAARMVFPVTIASRHSSCFPSEPSPRA